jgi:hypothetical protein
MDEATEASLLLEIDYTSYDIACRDPHITHQTGDLIECRLLRGHAERDGTSHATRAGARVYIWPAS